MRQKKKRRHWIPEGDIYISFVCVVRVWCMCTRVQVHEPLYRSRSKRRLRILSYCPQPFPFETVPLTEPKTGYCPGSPSSLLVSAPPPSTGITGQCDHTQHSLWALVFMLAQQALFSAELSPQSFLPFSCWTLTSGKVALRYYDKLFLTVGSQKVFLFFF